MNSARFHVSKCSIKEQKVYWSLLVLIDHFWRNVIPLYLLSRKTWLSLFSTTFVSQAYSLDICWWNCSSAFVHVSFWTLKRSLATLSCRQITRSNHQSCSVKKGVLRNFTKFIGKHLWSSIFFNKVTGLRSITLLKKRLWHMCFSVNFAKLRTPFLQNTSGRLFLDN